MRAAHSPGSTSASSVPASASSRTMSPSRSRASGPPSAASGVRWMAAGTLPDAPDMRPSVTSATLKPLSCSTPSDGVSLCSSGMPLACGPWKRTTATRSRSSSPALKAASSSSWSSKITAGASISRCCGLTAEILITPRPRLPRSSLSPPSAANGSPAGRTIAVSPLSAAPGIPDQRVALEARPLRGSARARPRRRRSARRHGRARRRAAGR